MDLLRARVPAPCCHGEAQAQATEETVVRQLSDLLAARDLTTDELGLLYCQPPHATHSILT